MSTPWIVAAIVGAFVLGLLLGVLGTRGARRSDTEGGPSEPSERSAGADVEWSAEARSAQPTDTESSERSEDSQSPLPAPTHRTEYVITSVGEPDVEVTGARKEFTPRPQLEHLARTVMIEAASLAHGVRNALSAENRAKISYEIKREVIRAKNGRKSEVKDALREYRAKHRAPNQPDGGSGL